MSSVGAVYTAELAEYLDVYLASSREQISNLFAQRDALEVKTAIYSDLKSKLSSLKTLSEELSQIGTLSAFGAKTATSGDADVLTATAGAGAMLARNAIAGPEATPKSTDQLNIGIIGLGGPAPHDAQQGVACAEDQQVLDIPQVAEVHLRPCGTVPVRRLFAGTEVDAGVILPEG